MFYPCDNYVFSVPVVFRSKAQYEGNGYCHDNCSCVVLLPSIRPTWTWEVRKMQGAIFCHGHIDDYWNVVAEHHRNALWVNLSMPTDCVAPVDKGLAIACEARLGNCSCIALLPSIHGHLAVNIDKLTEHAIITRIER